MKSVLVVLAASIICCLYSNSFAQTLPETQSWIKNVIENYPHVSSESYSEYEVAFPDKCQMVVNGRTQIPELNMDMLYRFSIPIENMLQIHFQEKSHSITMFFRVKPEGRQIDMIFFGTSYSGEKDSVELLMTKGLNQDNLKTRIIRAFNHYIELCGGSVLDDTF